MKAPESFASPLPTSAFGGTLLSYKPILLRAAQRLCEIKPSCILAIARKGPRLLQLMQALDLPVPQVPIYADHALDFLTKDDLGDSPVIFDDVVILGSSLFRIKNRLSTTYNVDAPVVTVLADQETYQQSFVPRLWASAWGSAADAQAFSSELIRAIPLLGVPYDIDHPMFTFPRREGFDVFTSIASHATSIHRELLTLQYDCKYSIFAIHSDTPPTSDASAACGTLGAPELFKIKVIDSAYQDRLTFVVVACFAPVCKLRLNGTYSRLGASAAGLSSRAQYRAFCFAAALAYSTSVDKRLSPTSLFIEGALQTLGKTGYDLVTRLLIGPPQSELTTAQPNRPTQDTVTQLASQELGGCFRELLYHNPRSQPSHRAFDRLARFWCLAFSLVEQPFRKHVVESLKAGASPKEALSAAGSDRLDTGLTSSQLRTALGVTDPVEWSLAMDLAVDSGVQVPIYVETEHFVARVYHHGEAYWEGQRFAALILKVTRSNESILRNISYVILEKWLTVLYDRIRVNAESGMFAQTAHYLTIQNALEVEPDALQIDDGYMEHGRGVMIQYRHQGLTKKGDINWSLPKAAAYWLKENALVLEDRPSSSTVRIPRVNPSMSLPSTLVPDIASAPVNMLFKLLATGLPKTLTIDTYTRKKAFDYMDILRLLSTCATPEKYIRGIAQDGYLVAQRRLARQDSPIYWTSHECRGPCAEIFRKWRVFRYRTKLFLALSNHCEANGLKDQFDLCLSPLQNVDNGRQLSGFNKIESLCHTLMYCVERIVNEGASAKAPRNTELLTHMDEVYKLKLCAAECRALANRTCEQIMLWFGPLLSGLLDEERAEKEIFLFSDMKASSLSQNIARAEAAKQAFVVELKALKAQYPALTFATTLDDAQSPCIPDVTAAKKVLRALIERYLARGLYARIGILSSEDTQERVTTVCEMTSAPISYAAAKTLAMFPRDCQEVIDGVVMANLDLPRKDQGYGVIVCSDTLFRSDLLKEPILERRRWKFLKEFLASTEEGYCILTEREITIGPNCTRKVRCHIVLYR